MLLLHKCNHGFIKIPSKTNLSQHAFKSKTTPLTCQNNVKICQNNDVRQSKAHVEFTHDSNLHTVTFHTFNLNLLNAKITLL